MLSDRTFAPDPARALSDYVALHADALLAYARRAYPNHDAEDLVQDTFERAMKAWPTKGEEIYSSGIAWAITTLTRLAIDQWRRDQRRPTTAPLEWAADPRSHDPGPEELALAGETAAAIWQIVSGLDDMTQAVFYLHFVQDKTMSEVAGELGLPRRLAYYHRDKARNAISRGLNLDGVEESEFDA